MNRDDSFIAQRGDYLLSYQKAECIYDITLTLLPKLFRGAGCYIVAAKGVGCALS